MLDHVDRASAALSPDLSSIVSDSGRARNWLAKRSPLAGCFAFLLFRVWFGADVEAVLFWNTSCGTLGGDEIAAAEGETDLIADCAGCQARSWVPWRSLGEQL